MSADDKYSALKRLKRNNLLTGAESNAELSSADYLGIGVLQLASANAVGDNKSLFAEFAKKASGKHSEKGLPHYSSKSLLLPEKGGSFEKAYTYLTQVASIAAGRGEHNVAALAEHRLFQLSQIKTRYGERASKKAIDVAVDPSLLRMVHLAWKT